MATISAMSSQTRAVYSMFNRMSNSTQSSQSNQYALMNAFFGSGKSKRNTGLASSLFSYYNAQKSSDLESLQAVTNGIRNMTTSYNETRQVFNTEYSATLTDVRKSAATVKSSTFGFTAEDIKTDDKGVQTYSNELAKTINNVKTLVKDYNEALTFLTDNKETSTQVSALANSFADTPYFKSSYEKVGISVGNDGKLSVNEQRLAKSLTENPLSSENTLKYTLANRADSKASLGQLRSASMFPSMNALMGKELGVASLYTGRTLNNIQRYSNSYNLFNIFA